MRAKRTSLAWGGVSVCLLSSVLLSPGVEPASAEKATAQSLGKLPLRFEANEGQFDPRVRYVARAGRMSLILTDAGARMTEAKTAVTMRVVGANKEASFVASDASPSHTNYFVGRDRARWRTNVPNYGRVTMQGVLPGVDQVFYGAAGRLEYDFVVAPTARPESIEVAFDGAESVAVNDAGDLEVHAGGGVIVQPKAKVYQREGARTREVASRYRVTGATTVAFAVADYDRTRELVIDPAIAYSTYFGGSSTDLGFAIAVDGTGAAYVAGETDSTDLPTANPEQDASGGGGEDAFIAKLSPDGAHLVYATYLGGSDTENAFGIAVDGAGAAYVTGTTASSDFPMANAEQSALNGDTDAFVAELSADGSTLVYSTYLGGSGQDLGYGIAVDSKGAAYVAGMTESTDFPTMGAAQSGAGGGVYDAFVTKLSAGGATLAYSTYLGGSAVEFAYGIAVDSLGAAYVTGDTTSTDFPTTNAAQATYGGGGDAFIAKLSADGATFTYATYLGGSAEEIGCGIAVDGSSAAYVTGLTQSTNFPTTIPEQAASGGGQDAFVAKIAAGGATIAYATYLGGTGTDQGYGIAVDATGAAYVAGFTESSNFPTANAIQATYGGSEDAFVAKLDSTGTTLGFSTYLGGTIVDAVRGLAIDENGVVYVAGYTTSSDFPTSNAAQGTYGGQEDGFITAIATADGGFGDAGGLDSGSDAATSVDSGTTTPDSGGGVQPSEDAGPIVIATDAGPPSPTPDASVTAMEDSGAEDAGRESASGGSSPGGGGGCSVARSANDGASSWAWAPFAALAAFASRRRRRL